VVLVPLCVGLAACNAVAEETPAVLNDPPGVYQKVKAVVDALNPGYDTIYNLWDANDKGGEWSHGVSASLFTITSEEIPLASIRLGYFVDHKIASGVKLDLPGLTRRYVPQTVKGIATTGYLEALWKVVGKFSAVGFYGGYDFDASNPITAVSLGAHVSF